MLRFSITVQENVDQLEDLLHYSVLAQVVVSLALELERIRINPAGDDVLPAAYIWCHCCQCTR